MAITYIEYQGLQIVFDGINPMLTQAQMARLFDISRDAVSEALRRAARRGFIDLEKHIVELRISVNDGKRYLVKHYDMQAIMIVGFRTNESIYAILNFYDWVQKAIQAMIDGTDIPASIKSFPQKRPTQQGYVYLLQAENGFYKIGHTKNLKKRTSSLSAGLPLNIELIHSLLCDDYKMIEANLHLKFADKCVNGEWFDLLPEDVEFICSLDEGGGRSAQPPPEIWNKIQTVKLQFQKTSSCRGGRQRA